MKKKSFRILSLILFILGVFFLLNLKIDITGALIGVPNMFSVFSSIWIALLLVSVVLFISGESLEDKLEGEHHWKKYPINKDSIIQDVEQEYLLSQKEDCPRTDIQERIERMVAGGKTILVTNKRRKYEEQFYEGHASQGGRVIDVKSHLGNSRRYKGKLLHFGQPANARYLWVVDETGAFIVANRQTFRHEMQKMNKEKIDYLHRLHKLPHATLARGKRIYGSGEVLIEGGLIKEVNTHSGHYIPITVTPGSALDEYGNNLIDEFNNQGKEVFRAFSKKYGWKEVKGGANYN